MAEKMTLRDRRRLETALEIRRATLSLCLSEGYEAVTTEMISAEAGISPRTFFNYFPNKDAALVGPADEMSHETIEAFRQGKGSLTEDFLAILRQHFDDQPPERAFLSGIMLLRARHPQVEQAYAQSTATILSQTASALEHRLGPGSGALAELLAATFITSVVTAMTHWAARDEATVDELLAEVKALLSGLARQLSGAG